VWAVILAAPAAIAQDTAGMGTIRGTVTTADGTPASNVAVCVRATSQCGLSDATGLFVITVRPDVYTLDITPQNASPVASQSFQVQPGLETRVEVLLPDVGSVQETLTVTAPALVAPQGVTTSGLVFPSRDVFRSAGALQDVSRYLQSLPGVGIGTNDFRNDLIIRGGSPLENAFIVDNIEIPNINSFATFASAGGTVSMLDVELVDTVTFLSGGYPAPYGNRTSSVVQVAQREGSRSRLGGIATVGFAGAGVVVEGPIASSRQGSWILSVRRSFLDLVTDDAGIGGVPVLYTINGKVVYDFTPRDRVWLVNVSGLDTIRLGLTEDSDLTSELANLDIRYDGGRSATGVNWQRVYGRGVGLFGVTHSRASVDQRVTDLLRNGVPAPGTPVAEQLASGEEVFREQSVESVTTTKYDLTWALGSSGTVRTGGSLSIARVDHQTASPYGTDSPFFPVQDLNPIALDEELTAYQGGAYLQATRPVTGRLTLTGGARVDIYPFGSEVRVSPRLGVDRALGRRFSLRASYGQYYQQPPYLFLTSYPENRALEPFRADHYVAGVTFEADAFTRVSVEAYRKHYRDYPVSSQIPSLSHANVGDTFAIRDVLFPMVSEGEGDVTGVEAYVQRREQEGRRWYGQANVALSRSRYSGLDGLRRPGSFDSPVVANVDGGYRLSDAWRVSARMTYLGGRPITPVDEAASASQRRLVYDLGRVNAERAPDYFRLDLRVDRTFGSGDRRVTLFAGVQNVTNRRNVAQYSWDRRANVLKVSDQLGVFPILGLEWPF
jgi:hypothetical protein